MSNVTQLGDRLKVMPTEGQIERDAIAEEGAEEYRRAPEFDQANVRHRALAVNGALNSLDYVRCTGAEYWSVYKEKAARDTFIKWARAAKSTIDDIVAEYDRAERSR
jgi:hypothetical protein